MSSIIKRGDRYAVVTNYTDPKGKRKQKWETFDSKKEAEAYKAQLDYAKSVGMPAFFPTSKTVQELLDEYIRHYGINKWSHNYYAKILSLIRLHVAPYIGKMKLKDISPRLIESYYQALLQEELPRSKGVSRDGEFKTKKTTPRTVRDVHKLLHSAFKQAERWELIQSNPFDKAMAPSYKEVPREIWELDDLKKALNACRDPILELCINLAFSCSLRIGEILGLTWDCVHISDALIESNSSWLFVDKQLQRISAQAAEDMDSKDIKMKFPSQNAHVSTYLVLKDPKTESSVRKVYIPKTVALMLRDRKEQVEKYKDYLGDEFRDFNLVICYENGTPIESNKIRNSFNKLIRDNNLPPVVFHSLRHSSTTYKLKLSGGDIKAVQGDTGHAEAAMITERYAHILDDDRRINTEKFEEMFYQNNEKDSGDQDLAKIISKLKESPELVELLKGLIK